MTGRELSALDAFRQEVNEKLDNISDRVSKLEVKKAVTEALAEREASDAAKKRDHRDFIIRNTVAIIALGVAIAGFITR